MSAEAVVRLWPGEAILFRDNGLVVLAATGDGSAELLAAAESAAATAEPGPDFCQAVVRLLADRDGLPALCAVGDSARGTVLVVHGDATMTAGELTLNGREAITIAERLLADPPSTVTGSVGQATPAGEPWGELGSGRVHAGGFRISAAPVAEAPPAAEPAAAPAPVADTPGTVRGLRCREGHFNDPGAGYCVWCGIGLSQAGYLPGRSERSVLGVLVLDDGRSLPLDRDHLLGRTCEPAGDDAARPVVLDDPLVSDVHAVVRLRGWEVSVVDAGSARGTYVRDPASRSWQHLQKGDGRVLRPGALIAVGGRQLRYESHRAA